MKLVLKKIDSATSMLLFIYRYHNFIAKSGSDEIKLSFILKTLKLFGKSETAIRMSLSRAMKSGLFTNVRKGSEVYYAPTSEGRDYLAAWESGVDTFLKRYRLRGESWNGEWVFLNLFERKGPEGRNNEFFNKIRNLGFSKVSALTFISPHSADSGINNLMNEYGYDKSACLVYGKLQYAGDMVTLLEKVYGLDTLKRPYTQFIKRFEGKLTALKKSMIDKQPVGCENAVPLFFEIGSAFFDTAFRDPCLPKAVLPEWAGDAAAAVCFEFMEILMPYIANYFKDSAA